jgi:hypothetical protein
LIHRLEEAASHLLVDLEAGAHDQEALIWVDDRHCDCSIFVCFGCFVVSTFPPSRSLTIIRNHETHEIHEIKRKRLTNDAFVFDFRVVAEVHKQAEFVARCFQVIVDLSAVDIVECLGSFEFQHNLLVTDEIWFVHLLQRRPL